MVGVCIGINGKDVPAPIHKALRNNLCYLILTQMENAFVCVLLGVGEGIVEQYL